MTSPVAAADTDVDAAKVAAAQYLSAVVNNSTNSNNLTSTNLYRTYPQCHRSLSNVSNNQYLQYNTGIKNFIFIFIQYLIFNIQFYLIRM